MSQSHQLGRLGEAAARHFLESCGFRCLDAGFRRPGGELDLVLQRDDLVVFAEVKTRGPRDPVPPEHQIHPGQLRRLRAMARHWIHENPSLRPRRFRFDVVAVRWLGEGRGLILKHLPDIA